MVIAVPFIKVRAEEVSDKKSLLTMVFSAQGLDKKVNK